MEVGFVALPQEMLPEAKTYQAGIITEEGIPADIVEYRGEIYLRTQFPVPGDWLHIYM